jgi:hypothetical protein
MDYFLKMLAAEKFDDYGRGPHDERFDPILPLADLLASSIVCLFMGLDPLAPEREERDFRGSVATAVFGIRVFDRFLPGS